MPLNRALLAALAFSATLSAAPAAFAETQRLDCEITARLRDTDTTWGPPSRWRVFIVVEFDASAITYSVEGGEEHRESCAITEAMIVCGTWPQRSINRYTGEFQMQYTPIEVAAMGAPFHYTGGTCRPVGERQF